VVCIPLIAAGQRLLLATYDNSRALRVYSVEVIWFRPPKPSQAEQEQKPPLNPSCDVMPMTVQYMCVPSFQNGTGSEAGQLHASPYALTHLEFIPIVPDPNFSDSNFPIVMAVFSPIVTPPVMMGSSQYHGGTSVVCRWNLKQGPEFKFLPVVEEIGMKPKGPNAAPPRVSREYFTETS
jgi:hypothetical protein